MDPAHWSWARLTGLSAAWWLATSAVAWYLVARVISQAKQADPSGGDFVVTLPYGTRHLTIYILLVLLPILAAIARKAAAG